MRSLAKVTTYIGSCTNSYLQKDETDNRSVKAKLFLVGMTPMLYLPFQHTWKKDKSFSHYENKFSHCRMEPRYQQDSVELQFLSVLRQI